MVEIINDDDYFIIKDNNISIKIGKNKSNYDLQIINNYEEIIIDNNNIKLICNIDDNSFIGINLYNYGIECNFGFEIKNNKYYYNTVSQIQSKGVKYTNSKLECTDDYICYIKYNSFIINKILKQLKLFFENKINISYNTFIKMIETNKTNINPKMLYSYKINDKIYMLDIKDIFLDH